MAILRLSHFHPHLLKKSVSFILICLFLLKILFFNWCFSHFREWGGVYAHFTTCPALVENLIFEALTMDHWLLRLLSYRNVCFCLETELNGRYWWMEATQTAQCVLVKIWNANHLSVSEIMTSYLWGRGELEKESHMLSDELVMKRNGLWSDSY